ncbi:hypothetical protein THAOC_26471, partial [Thalassiosira oceanica]
FGAVKQHVLLGGRRRPGAQMKALELYFSNMCPDFQGDLLVVELFHEAWSDVSARYRPLGASRDVLLGPDATYHHSGTLSSLGLAVRGVVWDTRARNKEISRVTADLSADLSKQDETKEATTKKRLFD